MTMTFTLSTAKALRVHIIFSTQATDRALEVWTRQAHEHIPPVSDQQPLRYLLAAITPPSAAALSRGQQEAVARHLHS